MRYLGGGRVSVSPESVRRFASTWPCSGLRKPRGGFPRIIFTFDADGNLIDVEGDPPDANGRAMVALSQEAYAHLARRRARRRPD